MEIRRKSERTTGTEEEEEESFVVFSFSGKKWFGRL